MWSKEYILCIFSWLAGRAPCWSECLLCLSDVLISKCIHYIVCVMVLPNRQATEERYEGYPHLNKFQVPGGGGGVGGIKLHLTSGSQEQGSHSFKNLMHLRHAPCWRQGFAPQSLLWALLRSDQGRAEEVTVNEMLFPPSQRFSDLKERHYKAQRKGSIWK